MGILGSLFGGQGGYMAAQGAPSAAFPGGMPPPSPKHMPSASINKAALGNEVLGTPQPQARRGLFGGAANAIGRGFQGVGKWMGRTDENGISNLQRIGLAGAALRDDPGFYHAALQSLDRQRSSHQDALQTRQDNKSAFQLRDQRRAEAAQYGIDERSPLFGLYQMNPELALSQLHEDQTAAPQRPHSRDRVDGNSTVVEQYNPQSGEWEEISRGPRWQPQQPPTPERPSMGGVMGRILDRIAQGETLSPGEEAALGQYQDLQRQPDPFAQMFQQNHDAMVDGATQRQRAASQGSGEAPARAVRTQAEFDALPSGALYINPSDGQVYRKN